ncbi:uncharacterized protein [Coffea arabica]|uniref:Uncharacterized protein isoform X1 n=1 Tax=Coffea arabica TaxID=13443 RepID=A0A6P6XAF4_COFAR|nr:uncharacterized protein LOC113740439 isoform X1 [Coffea arabica]
MEDSVKDQTSASGNAKRSASRLLRYPLRSAAKSKEEKPPLTDASNSSLPRTRGRIASSVSKSVGVLDLSGKEKSAKPPRRLSIPAKSTASPAPRSVGNTTPISEARAKRSTGKSDTPLSDVSKSSLRRKYNSLTRASYWLSLIKLSESASKQSVSLGFFKLALEMGCEPLQLLRDELKSYIRRHSLAEFGETLKELCQGYNISESLEQLQVSETCSHVPDEETRSSDDDVHSSSSSADSQKLKLEPSNAGVDKARQVKDPNKEKTQKNESATKVRRSAKKVAPNAKSGVEAGAGRTHKKVQKPRKQEPHNDKLKKQGKKSSNVEGSLNSPPEDKALQENKENVEAVETEEMSLSEV